MNEHEQNIERLREIGEEIENLVGEADNILMEYSEAHARAQAYWMSHIKGALYGRGSMVTLEDTIEELEEGDDEDDDSDE